MKLEKHHSLKRDIAYVADLVRCFDAHLTGVFIKPDSVYSPYKAKELSVEQYNALQNQHNEQATEIKEMFDSLTYDFSAKCEWRIAEVVGNDIATAFIRHTRYTDLVFLSAWEQQNEEHCNLIDKTLMQSGRPIMVLPNANCELEPIKDNIVAVTWDSSRESVRALHDAMPLLPLAKEVVLLCVDTDKQDDFGEPLPAADIAPLLNRHNINVSIKELDTKGQSISQCLVQETSNLDAKLLVVGACENSKIVEAFVGNVAIELLEQVTIPLLLSH